MCAHNQPYLNFFSLKRHCVVDCQRVSLEEEFLLSDGLHASSVCKEHITNRHIAIALRLIIL